MIQAVTYADKRMNISGAKCADAALRHGADIAVMYNEPSEWLRNVCPDILAQDRGAGYWIWKPDIIFRTLKESADGDIIVYMDAGVELIGDLRHVIDAMDQDLMLFGNHYNHKYWCKRRVYDEMGAVEGNQVQASAIIVRNCMAAWDFIGKWLDNCTIPGYIDDSTDGNEYPEFQEHRHDQAILTCLQQKYGYRLHWWPAVYNGGAFTYDKGSYTDTYPAIFHHHRKRNDEW